MQTQWRTGMGGATGLDYAGVRAYLALQGYRKSRQREIFDGIQAAEHATLAVWSENAKANATQPG